MKTNIKESAADYLMSQLDVCETKEDFILAFWFYWIDSITTNILEYQKVIASSAVNKWFLMELAKEELVYKHFIDEYPDTKGRDKDWLYCKCVSKLMSHFPKALLQEAKKRQKTCARELGIKISNPLTQN